MKNVSILGVTGSIGTQTLDVLRHHRGNFRLVSIAANRNIEKVKEIIDEFKPEVVGMYSEEAAESIRDYCVRNNYDVEIVASMEGLIKVATLDSCDIVVTSLVGMIGLIPTIEAIRKGKDIALANKETLVVAGEIVMEEAKKHKVKILPVDSEHSAIFQSLQGNRLDEVDKVILTASGGPFRGKDINFLSKVTVEDALKHPNWNMGQKITIDSSTLMNKGLEVIEAHWLFNTGYENIEVVVHPQSIVHSMVQYLDGSVIAQLGTPDMRLPIQYALNYPRREKNIAGKLNFYEIGKLTFEKPDMDNFKCLRLAYEAGKKGGIMPCILNGANEACVDLFLKRKISYLQIGDIIEECMNKFYKESSLTIDNIIETDKIVREYVYNKYN